MNPRILVVDDSLTVRMDLGEALQGAGFDVVMAASKGDARAAIAAEGPDLVILDVVLPDGDGVELLAELRRRSETSSLPVVLLSGEAEVKDRIRGIERGANAYVGKPYDRSYVVSRVASLLRPKIEGAEAVVLIVDDSITYRTELADLVASAGYEVRMAGSGEEGLRSASRFRPDALIVDGQMPDLDGTEVIRRLRADPGLQTTPCLLLTGSQGTTVEVSALDAGADGYAQKHEDGAVILARLGAMLRAARATRVDRGRGTTLLEPKRILAIDDSRDHLELLATTLGDEGYEIVRSSSGEQALDLLRVEQIDCILLDEIMPGLSGTQTCHRIKALPELRDIPLLMLSNVDDPGAVIAGINAGADDYVSKSATADVLKARVRAQLRRKQFEDDNRRTREEMLRKDAEARLARETADATAALLARIEQKNAELSLLNRELQMFAYSVSHDLRQPLRSMDGFSRVLLEDYSSQLDEAGQRYLQRIRAGAQRMSALIDGLLLLSRVVRQELKHERLDLAGIARDVLDRLRDAEPGRSVEVVVSAPLRAQGDPHLLESLLENLLGNAWKFSSKRHSARIEVGAKRVDGAYAYFVRDNGVGFDTRYADSLFAPFQRLHSDRDFPGTGIGLATAQRIVHRHGGRIWCESAPGEGATFYFTLASPTRSQGDESTEPVPGRRQS